ncbi:hypothetical protein [Pseudonocardia kunmingensis]|uniref:hypothetical protein n=1 Tax=Pseudonocardia kunmingensis TaxID=630975 RepID=UPI00115277FC|nr:hypothetical protein [Pseudonocardia kunmingensis]
MRTVLLGAAVCAVAVALTAPALAADERADGTSAADPPCPSGGPLGALLGAGSCDTEPPFPDLPPLLAPGDLLDRELPWPPHLPGGDESDGDSGDDSESGSEDSEDADEENTDEESGDEESGDEESTDEDGADEDRADEDRADDVTSDGDTSDDSGSRGDEDTDDRDTDLAAAGVDEAEPRERPVAAQARETARDAGADAAVGRAVLPGVGDAVDGAGSGLDWTGALGPPRPRGPSDPPGGTPAASAPQPASADPPARDATPPTSAERTADVAAVAFVDGLPSPGAVRWDVGAVLPSLVLTLLLLAGLALPAGLLNRAAADHADRVDVLLARLRVPPAAGRDAAGTFAVAVAVTAAAGAVLVGFLVPAFPFDGTAVAVLVGLAAAFVVVTAAQQGSQLLYVARWWGVRCHLTPFPGFLLLAAVGVVASRAVGLEPGLVLGTLVAFGTARPLRTDEAGPAAALAATALTAVGGLAWVLREPLVAAAGTPGSFGAAAAGTALTAVTAASAANLVLALAPLSFLPGAALLRWSPPLWALFACLGGFAFVHVVARPADGALAGRAGLLAVVLGLYLLGAAATWAWLRHGFSWTAPAPLNPAPRR